jgi:hypothetical protein
VLSAAPQFFTVPWHHPRPSGLPLGWITLSVTFEDPAKFRTERLQFEVVNFLGCYNAILGKLCYAKFMAIPNYAYLKLKMLGPCRVITATTSFKAAYA